MAAKPNDIRARAEANVASLDDARSRNPDPQDADHRPSLGERFYCSLTPFSDEELSQALQPYPHAFQDGNCGLFPTREVTVIGAPGREGKTRATFSLAVAYVLGIKVAGLSPQPDRSVLIYSAEDDRRQYAALAVAHRSRLGKADAAAVRDRIIVPDLMQPGMEVFAKLVTLVDRQPIPSTAVEGVIAGLQTRMDDPNPPGLIIFETASTLSQAGEDNVALSVLVEALRKVARALDVAVVIVHHTSQQAAANLSELAISTSDIRGATSLVFNSRQACLLVNLGSEEDPHPDSDARTVLRRMAAPGKSERVTVLVPLDSSKGMDPAPVFFTWHHTECGPALSVTPVPAQIAGARWRKLRQMVLAARADSRKTAKDEVTTGKVTQVVGLVARLEKGGRQPTVRAVSTEAGRGANWAAPYLALAVDAGDLRCVEEQVPRTRGMTTVYRSVDPSAGDA
ncbi:AAA family ATPase [Aerolutibacter daejeonensis]|uniref:AAA family ATPase n=1 Tax=Aerolutibacter daejeonensis TaxID=346181 RepID=UPI0018DC892E|nr:AAA family ATPase [Lysobacter daejeonensis]